MYSTLCHEFLHFYADRPRSAETNNNITVLAVALVCILLLLAVIAAIVIVICFVVRKKNKRKMLDLQEHVYDSVSVPAQSAHFLDSKTTKIVDDDEVKKSGSQKFELTDNVAYDSCKPLPADAPNAD